MKILFLTYYFEPDLCAGSFRNTSLFKELSLQIGSKNSIDVVTTQPNRYDSFKVQAKDVEKIGDHITVNRIKIPENGNNIVGHIKSFKEFYFKALKLVEGKEYDLVYASSSRLFTAFLGAKVARKKNAKLYLDIRDIFRETITDLYKKSILKHGLNLFLKPIENYTFGRADHVNLVSEGFKSYFDKFNKCTYSYYTNGIDDLFLTYTKNHKELSNDISKVKTITYGGNIGEGQGLDLIIPQVAEKVSGKFKFLIIGDGGTKNKLVKEIQKRNLNNVELVSPVNRNKLLEYYQNSDYLFLHLNDYKAFERVLPSKLFEYGSFNKPIIAGVGGYAKTFMQEHIDNLILFEPTNANQMCDKLQKHPYQTFERTDFKNRFSRKQINKLMAESIINLGNEK